MESSATEYARESVELMRTFSTYSDFSDRDWEVAEMMLRRGYKDGTATEK